MKTRKTKPESIITRAARIGVWLEPDGDEIIVHYSGSLSPDLERTLRKHKPALLAYLQSEQARIHHTAKQVMLGEFSGAPAALVSQLIRQLGWQQNQICQRASEKLRRDYLRAHPPTSNHHDDPRKK